MKVSLPQSVQFSHSVMSSSLRPHESQHARLPCPSPTPGIYSDSCPLSQWCHPTISSFDVPFLLLPSVFPSISLFSNESALRIRWPEYWSFSFNISPSNEHSGLISFRFDWFDLAGIYSIDYKHSLVWKIGRETNKTKQEQNLLMWTFLDSLGTFL